MANSNQSGLQISGLVSLSTYMELFGYATLIAAVLLLVLPAVLCTVWVKCYSDKGPLQQWQAALKKRGPTDQTRTAPNGSWVFAANLHTLKFIILPCWGVFELLNNVPVVTIGGGMLPAVTLTKAQAMWVTGYLFASQMWGMAIFVTFWLAVEVAARTGMDSSYYLSFRSLLPLTFCFPCWLTKMVERGELVGPPAVVAKTVAISNWAQDDEKDATNVEFAVAALAAGQPLLEAPKFHDASEFA